MKRLIVLALTLPVFLVGCGAPVEGDTNGNQPVDGTISQIDVDGTTCIVWDGYKAGGISCNWEAPKEVDNGFE